MTNLKLLNLEDFGSQLFILSSSFHISQLQVLNFCQLVSIFPSNCRGSAGDKNNQRRGTSKSRTSGMTRLNLPCVCVCVCWRNLWARRDLFKDLSKKFRPIGSKTTLGARRVQKALHMHTIYDKIYQMLLTQIHWSKRRRLFSKKQNCSRKLWHTHVLQLTAASIATQDQSNVSDDFQFVKYSLSCTSVLTYRFLFWPFTCSMTKNVEKTLLCQTKYAKKKLKRNRRLKQIERANGARRLDEDDKWRCRMQ